MADVKIDLVDRITADLRLRLMELEPLAREYERLAAAEKELEAIVAASKPGRRATSR